MRLEQLKYFDFVVRYGSFHKAAAAAHVAQPTLSTQIAALEKELNIKLLVRTRNGTMTTAEGLRIHEKVRIALAAAEDISTEALRLSRIIKIGIIPSIQQWGWLSELPNRMLDTGMEFQFHVRQHGAINIAALLENDQLDLGCLTWTDSLDSRFPRLKVRKLLQGHIVLALAKGHPLAGLASVRFEDFKNYPLILFPEGYLINEIIGDYLERMGSSYRVLYYSENGETMMRTIARGDAVGFLYGSILPPPRDAINLNIQTLPIADLEQAVWLVTARNSSGHHARILGRVVPAVEDLLSSTQRRRPMPPFGGPHG